MSDSAQDYTYEVTSINSNGLATIKMTSFDSLQYYTFMKVNASTTDSDVAAEVEGRIYAALADWENQRSTPSITVGSVVSTRHKTRSEGEKPVYNFLTQIAEQSDSETNDEIITSYTTRALSDSEKGEVYDTLSVTREELWQKLRNGSFIDTVLNGLGISQPIHASWDATAGASYDWSTDKIASLNVDSVSRVGTGRFKVHFANPMDDSNYSVFCTVGSTDYSGVGAGSRTLSVMDRTPNYVEVLCERADDAVNEDNFFNSVAISASKDSEEDSDYVAMYNRPTFNFRDGLSQTIKGLLSKNDSDFADFLVNG